jgi:hypothetical protein
MSNSNTAPDLAINAPRFLFPLVASRWRAGNGVRFVITAMRLMRLPRHQRIGKLTR